MKEAILSGLYLASNKNKYLIEVKYKLATMLFQKLKENVMYSLVCDFLKTVDNEMIFYFIFEN